MKAIVDQLEGVVLKTDQPNSAFDEIYLKISENVSGGLRGV